MSNLDLEFISNEYKLIFGRTQAIIIIVFGIFFVNLHSYGYNSYSQIMSLSVHVCTRFIDAQFISTSDKGENQN